MQRVKRPMLGIVCLFSAGILCSQIILPPLGVSLFCAAGSFVLISLFILKRKMFLCFFLPFVFLSGVLYANARQVLAVDDIFWQYRFVRGKTVELKGVIVSDVIQKAFNRTRKNVFQLQVQRIFDGKRYRDVRGKVLVNSFKEMELSYGDVIRIEGKLHKPFSDFGGGRVSYRDYLLRRGIRLILSSGKSKRVEIVKHHKGHPFLDCAYQLRRKFRKVFDGHFSKAEASILKAILIGDRSQISSTLRKLFVETGTAHILAISGLNITIIAGLFFLIFRLLPVGRSMQCLLTMMLLIGYAFLTGFHASVVRATIMALIILGSYMAERETDGINSLCWAAFLILLINPQNIHDLGFQLSFLSVLTIFLWTPIFIQLFHLLPVEHTHPVIKFIFASLSISLSAWLGVTGLILYYFETITPIAIIANLGIVPMINLLMVLGVMLLVVASVAQPLIIFVAGSVKIVLNALVAYIYLLNKFPWGCFYYENFDLWCVGLYYGILSLFFCFFVIILKKLKKLKFSLDSNSLELD